MLLVFQTFLGFAQFDPEFQEALATDVPQFHLLQVLPNTLIGVEIRNLTGKPL